MFGTKCGAKARTNGYKPCRQPTMANGRCRFHGGKNIGPKTEEGKKRMILANTKHGFYLAENISQRNFIKESIDLEIEK